MKSFSGAITVLCSYVTLGTYIPALLLHRRLEEMGCESELVALEQLFPESKLGEIPKFKKAIHGNFKFAKTALKMASKNNASSFDDEKVEALFKRWSRKENHRLIVFTGFWSEIVNRYLRGSFDVTSLHVDLIYMDANLSPSWKGYDDTYENTRIIQLFDAVQKKITCFIPPDSAKFREAGDTGRFDTGRFLVHGGGWGIGTYKEKVGELLAHGLPLNVVAYEPSEMGHDDLISYHLLDPEWKPYQENKFTFPVIQQAGGGNGSNRKSGDAYYPYYDLVMSSRAIISKPGGGTLNDSIASRTPIVFLEPFGEHEMHNANLWKDLGYGIDFEDWKNSNFSLTLLDQLRSNLKEGRKGLRALHEYYTETIYQQ